MAKIIHGEYYLVDPNDEYDKEDLIREFYNQFDIHPSNHFVVESKEFEWDDDIDVNKIDCPIEAYKKYFEE